MDCHSTEYIDWQALGWSGDPLKGGERFPATQQQIQTGMLD